MHASTSKGRSAPFAPARLGAFPAVALLIVSLLTACGREAETAPVTAAAIAITSPSGAVPSAGTMQFVANVTDAKGNTISATPTWTLVNGGGTITSGGLFTAGDSIGTFVNTIVATIGSVTSTSSVTVSAGALASIAVTPLTVSLAIGGTQRYTAVGHDAHGHVVDIPSRTWSAASGAGTIDTSGLFTAGTTAGTMANAVTATSGAISGSTSVTINAGELATIAVTPATTTLAIGATQQFTAVGKDANNNVVPVEATWSVVASGGMINSGTGVFTAGAVAGAFANTVRAAAGAISATSSVTVSPGAVATIAVSPATVSLAIGATQQYTAVARDAHDNVVTITPAWSVSGGGGTIDAATGLYTAGATAGTYDNAVTAMSGGITGTASVVVMPAAPPLASITITPAMGYSFLFGPIQFTATGYDARGSVVAITPVWSVSSPSLGTISQRGFFIAVGGASGSYPNSIFATVGSIVGTAGFAVSCMPICY